MFVMRINRVGDYFYIEGGKTMTGREKIGLETLTSFLIEWLTLLLKNFFYCKIQQIRKQTVIFYNLEFIKG